MCKISNQTVNSASKKEVIRVHAYTRSIDTLSKSDVTELV